MRPAIRVVPCMDIKDGRIVKGVKFQNLRDMGDPANRAAVYQKQGGDEIVLLDVSATPEGRAHAAKTVRDVRAALSIPLTVGGGVRSIDDAALLLEAGADKIGINTAAVARPFLVKEISRTFGAQCTVLAIDAARRDTGHWEVMTHAGTKNTQLDVVEWAQQVAALGAGEILLTSWDNDGTKSGYDVQLVDAVATKVMIPVIASGGARNGRDLVSAAKAGAAAVLVASMLHEGRTTVEHLKRSMSSSGIRVRPC